MNDPFPDSPARNLRKRRAPNSPNPSSVRSPRRDPLTDLDSHNLFQSPKLTPKKKKPRKSLGRRVSFAATAHVRLFEAQSDEDSPKPNTSEANKFPLQDEKDDLYLQITSSTSDFQIPDLSSIARRTSNTFDLKLDSEKEKENQEVLAKEKTNEQQNQLKEEQEANHSFEIKLKPPMDYDSSGEMSHFGNVSIQNTDSDEDNVLNTPKTDLSPTSFLKSCLEESNAEVSLKLTESGDKLENNQQRDENEITYSDDEENHQSRGHKENETSPSTEELKQETNIFPKLNSPSTDIDDAQCVDYIENENIPNSLEYHMDPTPDQPIFTMQTIEEEELLEEEDMELTTGIGNMAYKFEPHEGDINRIQMDPFNEGDFQEFSDDFEREEDMTMDVTQCLGGIINTRSLESTFSDEENVVEIESAQERENIYTSANENGDVDDLENNIVKVAESSGVIPPTEGPEISRNEIAAELEFALEKVDMLTSPEEIQDSNDCKNLNLNNTELVQIIPDSSQDPGRIENVIQPNNSLTESISTTNPDENIQQAEVNIENFNESNGSKDITTYEEKVNQEELPTNPSKTTENIPDAVDIFGAIENVTSSTGIRPLQLKPRKSRHLSRRSSMFAPKENSNEGATECLSKVDENSILKRRYSVAVPEWISDGSPDETPVKSGKVKCLIETDTLTTPKGSQEHPVNFFVTNGELSINDTDNIMNENISFIDDEFNHGESQEKVAIDMTFEGLLEVFGLSFDQVTCPDVPSEPVKDNNENSSNHSINDEVKAWNVYHQEVSLYQSACETLKKQILSNMQGNETKEKNFALFPPLYFAEYAHDGNTNEGSDGDTLRSRLHNAKQMYEVYAKESFKALKKTWYEAIHASLRQQMDEVQADINLMDHFKKTLEPGFENINQTHHSLRQQIEETKAKILDQETKNQQRLLQLKETIDKQKSLIAEKEKIKGDLIDENSRVEERLCEVSSEINDKNREISKMESFLLSNKIISKCDLEDIYMDYSFVSSLYGWILNEMSPESMTWDYDRWIRLSIFSEVDSTHQDPKTTYKVSAKLIDDLSERNQPRAIIGEVLCKLHSSIAHCKFDLQKVFQNVMIDCDKFQPLWKDVLHLGKYFKIHFSNSLSESNDTLLKDAAYIFFTLQLELCTERVDLSLEFKFSCHGYPNSPVSVKVVLNKSADNGISVDDIKSKFGLGPTILLKDLRQQCHLLYKSFL